VAALAFLAPPGEFAADPGVELMQYLDGPVPRSCCGFFRFHFWILRTCHVEYGRTASHYNNPKTAGINKSSPMTHLRFPIRDFPLFLSEGLVNIEGQARTANAAGHLDDSTLSMACIFVFHRELCSCFTMNNSIA